MNEMKLAGLAIGLAGLAGSAAFGAVTVTQGASAPTYTTTLTFDEPGGPTGEVMGDEWQGIGVTQLVSGTGVQAVSTLNTTPGLEWLGTGNVFSGSFGVFMTFESDVCAFSAQYWDSSGPGGPFGGGAAVIALNDGLDVGSLFIPNPPFGPGGDTWINIVADSGMVFDEVRFVGFGFPPDAFVDNLSWKFVPAPGTACLAALGLMAGGRRRRH